MKKSVYGSKLLLVGLLLAGATVSCQKESIPAPVIPELSGEIKFPARVGLGQRISITYTLPTPGPTNVSHSEYSWLIPEEVTLPNLDGGVDANGVAHTGFQPKQMGEFSLKFIAKYTPKDGTPVVIHEKSQKYTVVACDVASSFWGDSKEMVLHDTDTPLGYPLKDDGADLTRSILYPQHGLVMVKFTATRRYSFTDSKLSKVVDMEVFEDARIESLMSQFVLTLDGLKSDPTEFYTLDIASGVKTNRTLAEFKGNLPNIQAIGREIGAKKITPVAVVVKGDTKITLTMGETRTIGNWAYNLEYVKK